MKVLCKECDAEMEIIESADLLQMFGKKQCYCPNPECEHYGLVTVVAKMVDENKI